MLPTIIVVVVLLVIVGAVVFALMRKKPLPELPDEPVQPLRTASSRPPAKLPSEAPKPPSERPPPASERPEEAPESAPAESVPMSLELEAYQESISPGPPPAPPPKRAKDVKGLRKGLKKVRESGGLFGRLKALFVGKNEIDPGIVEEIEEILLTSDVGTRTTEALLAEIREGLEKNELADGDRVWEALRDRAVAVLSQAGGGPLRFHGHPTVVLMVGVNGTGKTTTIGKLATKFAADGKKVLLVAGDTFRAAAVQQLKIWGKRVGCEVFAGKDGADPASVVFDAVEHAAQDNYDYVLVDTAGRLHTKSNLMDELKKVAKTCGKALDGSPHETLLVLDGTTGQNAIQQTEMFGEALEITGIVLTKLDGTAKGGVILAIASEHDLPVRYIGVGERADHLRDFDAEEFVEAMLGLDGESIKAA